jgi:hypothetical protein
MGYLRVARDDGRDSLHRANAPPQEFSGCETYFPGYVNRITDGKAVVPEKIAFYAEPEYGKMP